MKHSVLEYFPVRVLNVTLPTLIAASRLSATKLQLPDFPPVSSGRDLIFLPLRHSLSFTFRLLCLSCRSLAPHVLFPTRLDSLCDLESSPLPTRFQSFTMLFSKSIFAVAILALSNVVAANTPTNQTPACVLKIIG